MSSNEVRGKVGLKPSDDPKADQLINSNLNQASAEEAEATAQPPPDAFDEIQNEQPIE